MDDLAGRLLSVSEGDGAARSWWRSQVHESCSRRRLPLHLGVILTELLAGDDLDDAWIVPLEHGRSVALLPPPGALCVIPTRTDLGDIYGQVLATHLQPEQLEADGSLPEPLSSRRVIVDLEDGIRGFELADDERSKLDRIRRNGVWLGTSGHLRVELARDEQHGDLRRYADWLAADDRRRLRRDLPDTPAALYALLVALLDAAGSYESSIARVGSYLCDRDQVEQWLEQRIGQGRLRDEFVPLGADVTRLYRSIDGSPSSARRSVAALLDEHLSRLERADRARLAVGPAWLRTLFCLCETLQQRLPVLGPPLLEDEGRTILVRNDERYGIAGVWDIEEVDETTAERMRSDARAELDREYIAASRTEARARRVPFQFVLSRAALSRQAIILPPDVLAQVPDGAPLRVRLACDGSGRYAHQRVVVATDGVPDAGGSLPMRWPALLRPNTVLDGLLCDHGRRIELSVRSVAESGG
jgi:hypothetical protein